MGTRVKTFNSSGIATDGRLYASDLNSIQDQYADLVNYAQNMGVGVIAVGESGLQLLKYGSGEARLTGLLRTDGLIRSGGGVLVGVYTVTSRNAIPAGKRPAGMLIYNQDNTRFEWNAGDDATPSWQPIWNTASGHLTISGDLKVGGLVGFYGATPQAKPTVSGSGLDALTDLLAELATLGLITNSATVGVNPMVLIQEVTSGPTFDWISIPQTYRHLEIYMECRATSGSGGTPLISLRFNDDASTNYDSAYRLINTSIGTDGDVMGNTLGVCGVSTPTNAQADDYGFARCTIFNYANTTRRKHWTFEAGLKQGTGAGGATHIVGSGHWRSVSAVSEIELFAAIGSFAAGSRAQLYGIA